MRHPRPLLAVLWLCACSPNDLARLEAAAAPSGLHALSHDVAVRFEPGAATLRVRRSWRNDTADHQSLSRALPLPESAIASSLRVGVDGRWPEPAQLTTVEDAEARWAHLTSEGEGPPSTLGLLQWSGEGVDLELFALAPGSTAEVEYQVELSATYEAGEQRFVYPRDDEADALAPRFEVAAGALLAPLEGATPEAVDEAAWVLRQRHQPLDVLDARWAVSPLDTDRTLWRLELDAAPRLGEAPVRPNIVFVVDGSHSEGPEGISAQLELIAPYLENARDAAVEVVVYRRFAQRLFGRFVPAREVPALLATLRVEPGNGSALELGAALAAETLARVGGPARVVLFTDERLRTGFSLAQAQQALSPAPNDTVVHVVARTNRCCGALSEQRDDGAALAPLADSRGGIFLRVEGAADDLLRSADTLLPLVRPTRIDDLLVEAPGVPEDQLQLEALLVEGTSLRATALAAAPPTEVVITGKVWAQPFRRVVPMHPHLAARLPGIAVGQAWLREQLSDDELRTAAFLAHAVSPVTSYLWAPAHAGPSTAGLGEGELGGLSIGGIGCSGGSSSGCSGFGMGGDRPDFEALLRALLAPAVARCAQTHGATGAAGLRLEATGDEVVDVNVSNASGALADCLTEAAWAVRLSPPFNDHRSYALTFP